MKFEPLNADATPTRGVAGTLVGLATTAGTGSDVLSCCSVAGSMAPGGSTGIEDGTWISLPLSAAKAASLLAFNASIALSWSVFLTILESPARFLPVNGFTRAASASLGAIAPLIIMFCTVVPFLIIRFRCVLTNPSLSSLPVASRFEAAATSSSCRSVLRAVIGCEISLAASYGTPFMALWRGIAHGLE